GRTRGEQAEGAGALESEDAADQNEPGGSGDPNRGRQENVDADIAGREPDADEGGVHPCTLAGDADIGGERQCEAAAAGRAVHEADDRLAATPHAHHDLADAALAEEPGIGAAARRVGRRLVAALGRFLLLYTRPTRTPPPPTP